MIASVNRYLLLQMSVSLTHVSMGHHARTKSTSTFVSASQDTSVFTARKKIVSEGRMGRNEHQPRNECITNVTSQFHPPLVVSRHIIL